MQGTLYGLKFMHEKDFAHLDVKLENLLLNFSNESLLADYGHTVKNARVCSSTK